MRICIDARVGTKGGTSSFVDGFIRQIQTHSEPTLSKNHSIEIIAHSQQKLATTQSLAVPATRMQELLWAQRALPGWLRENNFDVYHSLKHVGPVSCPCRSIYRVPAVGQFDGSYPLSFSERVYWAHLGKRVYRKADFLIAVSDYIRDGLIKHLGVSPDRVCTIRNGVDERFRRLPACEIDRSWIRDQGMTRPFVLSVGNVVPVKNIESTIRAIGHLCQSRDVEHDLVIAGSTDNTHASMLRQLATRLGIGDRVHFLGFQNKQRLIQLYSATDALVHMSLHEGFSLTILEAMACGVPVLAARTSSIPEAAGDAARYVESPNDVGEIANQIESLLGSESDREALAAAAVRRSRRFSWQSCVEKTLAVYSKIAEVSPCAV